MSVMVAPVSTFSLTRFQIVGSTARTGPSRLEARWNEHESAQHQSALPPVPAPRLPGSQQGPARLKACLGEALDLLAAPSIEGRSRCTHPFGPPHS